jgi:hypothetical protein
MAFDQGKPALTLRRTMKAYARLLLSAHSLGQELSRELAALGIDYTVIQGSYAVDNDAAAFVALSNNSILSFLQTNAAVITKAADLGDNIT